MLRGGVPSPWAPAYSEREGGLVDGGRLGGRERLGLWGGVELGMGMMREG